MVQDMYEDSEFKVGVRLHHASALSSFFFAVVMDRLDSPWTVIFADDIVVYSKSRELEEESQMEVCSGDKRTESQQKED